MSLRQHLLNYALKTQSEETYAGYMRAAPSATLLYQFIKERVKGVTNNKIVSALNKSALGLRLSPKEDAIMDRIIAFENVAGQLIMMLLVSNIDHVLNTAPEKLNINKDAIIELFGELNKVKDLYNRPNVYVSRLTKGVRENIKPENKFAHELFTYAIAALHFHQYPDREKYDANWV